MHHIISLRRERLFAILAVLILLLAWGCATGPKAIKSTDLISTPDLLLEAATAWDSKEFEAAELYYSKVLERQDFPADQRVLALSRLTYAAWKSGHYQQSRMAAEEWGNAEPEALKKWSWQEPYINSLAALDKQERLRNNLDWARTAVLPWETADNLARWYYGYFAGRDDFELAMRTLAEGYGAAPDEQSRLGLETWLRETLSAQSDEYIQGLAGAVEPSRKLTFPYALAVFEKNRRLADDKALWPVAWRELADVVSSSALEDRGSLAEILAGLEKEYGLPQIGVALALPLGGPYGEVGRKILRGVALAQWQLATQGLNVDIKAVNTAAPGWEKRLAELPENYSLVGGPLRVEAFKALAGNGSDLNQLKKRAFFTFLSSLGDATEGKDAWRFFSSRGDEVRSLVRLAVEQLGIKDLAVFYPEEKFGRTMAQTFYQEALPLGGRIRGMVTYPPKDLPAWGRSVAKLLKVPTDFSENKEAPLPMPDFGAVFIPDGWSQAQSLLPNFFFYEADQLLYLGPGLWSRSLEGAKDVEAQYYQLAVCPGAWWNESEGARMLGRTLAEEGLGQADFWVALGYDFLRFAGRMGVLPHGWSASEVNKRIRNAQDMEFSMAAMTWTADGVASQQMYLFSPKSNGKDLVNAEILAERIEKAKARRVRRVENYRLRLEEENAKKK